ncbi:hypothetical protein LTR49_008544 [Elasticomyces elasticus]|nr:hypothetical protein LTR49_008544 [Elasticomyces elasticus]
MAVVGAGLAWNMADLEDVVRSDGSQIATRTKFSWKEEASSLWESYCDPYILCLVPMFFTSDWLIIFQQQAFADVFDQQRLNDTTFWGASLVGALALGFGLDSPIRRITRSRILWVTFSIFTLTLCGAWYITWTSFGYGSQRWTMDGRLVILYTFFGFYYAVLQVTIYWTLGALSSDPRKLAHYAGIWRSWQAAGAIALDLVEEMGTSDRSFYAIFAPFVASLIIAAPVMWWGVDDATQPRHGSVTDHQATEDTGVPLADLAESHSEPTANAVEASCAGVAMLCSGPPPDIDKPRSIWCRILQSTLRVGLVVLSLGPVWMATAGLSSSTFNLSGCLPDGFGSFSFAVAKLIDTCWDLIVGRGGQALLVWVAYKVIHGHFIGLMENGGIPTEIYAASSFGMGSFYNSLTLVKYLTRKDYHRLMVGRKRHFVMMLYISVHILVFPTIISAMTSYSPVGVAHVDIAATNATTETILFSSIDWMYNTTSNSSADHVYHYGNITLNDAQLLARTSCRQTNTYQWGFSFSLLFVFAVLNSLFMLMLVLLWEGGGGKSKVYKSNRQEPGVWRAVMDMSSHAKAQVGTEAHRWATRTLEEAMNKTLMKFENDGPEQVLSAVPWEGGPKKRNIWNLFAKSQAGYGPLPRTYDGV